MLGNAMIFFLRHSIARRLLTASAVLFLAGCAARRWTVCFDTDDATYCRSGYHGKHDATVAGQTVLGLPGVNSATIETDKNHERKAAQKTKGEQWQN